jgi:hypothetical protein
VSVEPTRGGYRSVTLTTFRDVPWNMPEASTLRVGVVIRYLYPLSDGTGRWLWSVPSMTGTFGRLSQIQGFETRYQRGRFDTQNVRGPIRPVNPSIGELKRRANVLALTAPPLYVRYHITQRTWC